MNYLKDGVEALVAWPSQRDAARMLGVDESTLSRRSDVERERYGERELRLPPAEVLRLADAYRRRSVNAVAADLLKLARDRAPELEGAVRSEIDEYFARRAPIPIDNERFLAQARRTLPRALYEQVERAYSAGADEQTPPVAAPPNRWVHT